MKIILYWWWHAALLVTAVWKHQWMYRITLLNECVWVYVSEYLSLLILMAVYERFSFFSGVSLKVLSTLICTMKCLPLFIFKSSVSHWWIFSNTGQRYVRLYTFKMSAQMLYVSFFQTLTWVFAATSACSLFTTPAPHMSFWKVSEVFNGMRSKHCSFL